MIYGNTLTKIINEEYERKVRQDNTNPNKLYGRPLPKAMLLRFRIEEAKSKEYKETYLEMMIFGQGYVTVLHRITHSRDNYRSGDELKERLIKQTDWIKDCCHDSCWRYDGIERLISGYQYRDSKWDISGIDELFGWYSVIDLDDKLYEHFSSIK